jgi:hypothetical protein
VIQSCKICAVGMVKCADFVGCIFVFAPNGLVQHWYVNNSSSWCDIFIPENSGMQHKLEQVFTVGSESTAI